MCTESAARQQFLSQLRRNVCSGMGSADMLLFWITIFPIIASVLLVLRNKLYTRTKFETLRAAAEKVRPQLSPCIHEYFSLPLLQTKRHIYEFRTRTGYYSNAKFANARLVECVRTTRG